MWNVHRRADGSGAVSDSARSRDGRVESGSDSTVSNADPSLAPRLFPFRSGSECLTRPHNPPTVGARRNLNAAIFRNRYRNRNPRVLPMKPRGGLRLRLRLRLGGGNWSGSSIRLSRVVSLSSDRASRGLLIQRSKTGIDSFDKTIAVARQIVEIATHVCPFTSFVVRFDVGHCAARSLAPGRRSG